MRGKISLSAQLKMQRRVEKRGKVKNPRSAFTGAVFHFASSLNEETARLQDTTPSNHRHKSSRTNLITRTSQDNRTNEKMNVKFIYGSHSMLFCRPCIPFNI
jgi:hypothetical protein